MLGNVYNLCANWSTAASVGGWFGVPIANAKLEKVFRPWRLSNVKVWPLSSISLQRTSNAATESANVIASKQSGTHQSTVWKTSCSLCVKIGLQMIQKKLISCQTRQHRSLSCLEKGDWKGSLFFFWRTWWHHSSVKHDSHRRLEFWRNHEHQASFFKRVFQHVMDEPLTKPLLNNHATLPVLQSVKLKIGSTANQMTCHGCTTDKTSAGVRNVQWKRELRNTWHVNPQKLQKNLVFWRNLSACHGCTTDKTSARL